MLPLMNTIQAAKLAQNRKPLEQTSNSVNKLLAGTPGHCNKGSTELDASTLFAPTHQKEQTPPDVVGRTGHHLSHH